MIYKLTPLSFIHQLRGGRGERVRGTIWGDTGERYMRRHIHHTKSNGVDGDPKLLPLIHHRHTNLYQVLSNDIRPSMEGFDYQPALAALVSQMWATSPSDRPSAAEVAKACGEMQAEGS